MATPRSEELGALARRVADTLPPEAIEVVLEGQPVETIWWSRELAEELLAAGGSPEPLAGGVALRTSGLLAEWQARRYPDELATERIDGWSLSRSSPERLAARIEAELAEPDARTSVRLMTELQLDTVRLAPSGPNVDRARAWLAAGLDVLRK